MTASTVMVTTADVVTKPWVGGAYGVDALDKGMFPVPTGTEQDGKMSSRYS